MSEPITITAILAAAGVVISIVLGISKAAREQRDVGKTEAGQLAALQLAQVQAASASALASTQLEARLVRQIDALVAQVSALTQTVADLTRDTDERLRRIEADTDADRRSMAETLAKLGRQVDRLLVEAARHGTPAHGTSEDHIPATRIPTGRYSGPGTGGE